MAGINKLIGGGKVFVVADDPDHPVDPSPGSGAYFVFNGDEMSKALGRQMEDGEVLPAQIACGKFASYHERQTIKKIKVFCGCYGRLEPAQDGDWKVGDCFQIVARQATQAQCAITKEEQVNDFADRIESRFKVVAWDMDQCAVRHHSRGRLQRVDLEEFAKQVSPDFVLSVKELARRGRVGLAIATASDLAEHSPERPRGSVILGDELALEVLRLAVPDQAHLFHVVGFNPRARNATDPDDLGKKRHLRTIAAYYNVALADCVLFDDDDENCTKVELSHGVCKGTFHAFKSNPSEGFRLSDLTHEMTTSGSRDD